MPRAFFRGAEGAVTAEVFDARGCLTSEGFARIAAAPPGRAPAELAAHLASCARCQRRLLATASSEARRSGRRAAPSAWRTALVMIAGVLLVILAVGMLRYLTIPRP
jgi:hypothetical protein